MKKVIMTVFIAMLSVVVLPISGVSAANGVDGGIGSDGGSNSPTQPGDKFQVTDLASGESFTCTVTTLTAYVWIIECISGQNNDLFTVRVYINNGVLVHEVTVSKVVSSGATVESLKNRAIGLSNSIKNKSPFGQTNYNTKLVSSNALYNVAMAQTGPNSRAMAEAERQTCFGYFPNDVRCDGGYNNYQPALNNYLALSHIAFVGFQTPVSYPVTAASFFPAYPSPSTDIVPASGSDGGNC